MSKPTTTKAPKAPKAAKAASASLPAKSRTGGGATTTAAPEVATADLPAVRPTTLLRNIPADDLDPHLPNATQLKQMFGVKTDTAAIGLMCTALNALGLNGTIYRDFVFAMGAELEPRNSLEAMIVLQIGLSHAALCEAMRWMWDAKDHQARESYERMASRLARTFGANVDLLRRHRSGGSQTVRVEHVTVHEGGQAIVGNVTGKPGVS